MIVRLCLVLKAVVDDVLLRKTRFAAVNCVGNCL